MTEPTEGAKPQDPRFVPCSDCQAPIRDKYWALNERALCAKCRIPYAKKIQRSDGPGNMMRAGIAGGIIAVVGGVVLAIVVGVLPSLKWAPLIPIGWLIGKRIMASVDNYSSRRHQYLAVALTYLSFLGGIGAGTFRSDSSDAERRAETRKAMQGTAATQTDAIAEEMKSMRTADSIEAVQNGDTLEAEEDSADAEPAAAAPAKEDRIGPGPGLLIFAFFLLPLLSMMGFGMASSAIGIVALGYAFYQTWHQSDGQGMDLQLSGPFKMGEGPIEARGA